MAYPDFILVETSLVSYWRLGEASGTLADSADSNPSTGVGAGLTYGAGGLISDPDTAVSLNGTTGWVKVANAANLQLTGALSLECWIKPSALTADYNALIAKFAGDGKAYDLYVHGSGGSQNGAVTMTVRGGGSNREVDTANGLVSTGNVSHIVATYTDALDMVDIFVNGGRVAHALDVTTVLDFNTALLSFGGRSSDGIVNPDGLFFSGVIDEVAVYNDALTQTQVSTHYNAGFAGRALGIREPRLTFGPF